MKGSTPASGSWWGAIILVFNPLDRCALKPTRVSNIPTIICSFHSLLVNGGIDPIRVFYKSFPGRRKDKKSFVDPLVHHHEILLSLQSMCAGSGRSTLLGSPAVATMSSKYKR